MRSKKSGPVANNSDGAQAMVNVQSVVLAAARILFAEEGFDQMSLFRLSEVTGVDQAAIRKAFGGKAGLYMKILVPIYRKLDLLTSLTRKSLMGRLKMLANVGGETALAELKALVDEVVNLIFDALTSQEVGSDNLMIILNEYANSLYGFVTLSSDDIFKMDMLEVIRPLVEAWIGGRQEASELDRKAFLVFKMIMDMVAYMQAMAENSKNKRLPAYMKAKCVNMAIDAVSNSLKTWTSQAAKAGELDEVIQPEEVKGLEAVFQADEEIITDVAKTFELVKLEKPEPVAKAANPEEPEPVVKQSKLEKPAPVAKAANPEEPTPAVKADKSEKSEPVAKADKPIQASKGDEVVTSPETAQPIQGVDAAAAQDAAQPAQEIEAPAALETAQPAQEIEAPVASETAQRGKESLLSKLRKGFGRLLSGKQSPLQNEVAASSVVTALDQGIEVAASSESLAPDQGSEAAPSVVTAPDQGIEVAASSESMATDQGIEAAKPSKPKASGKVSEAAKPSKPKAPGKVSEAAKPSKPKAPSKIVMAAKPLKTKASGKVIVAIKPLKANAPGKGGEAAKPSKPKAPKRGAGRK